MKKILGLDLGSNSIGWTLIKKGENEGEILGMGVRVFPMGVQNLGEGEKEISNNASRREARQARRQIFRRKLRKRMLLKLLSEHNMCPLDPPEATAMNASSPLPINEDVRSWFALNPYELRERALHEKLSLQELGRVFYHMAQRRGFQSNSRNASEDGTIFDGKPKEGKTGINATWAAMGEDTLGAYLNSIQPADQETYKKGLPRIRNRYTVRSMYIKEFEAIWEAQSSHHSSVLTPGLKEQIGGRKNESNYQRDGVLFYQRPLRSQKHLIGKCSLEPSKPRCPVSAIEFELFRAHQFINTIEFNGERLSEMERMKALDVLLKKEAPKFKELRKKLNKLDAAFKSNYKDDDKCPGSYTIRMLSNKQAFGSDWFNKSDKEQQDIWHVLLSFEDKDKLESYAREHWGFDTERVTYISKIRLREGYAQLSRKAIRNILPWLELGHQYDVAVALGGVKNAFGSRWEGLTDADRDFIDANVPAIVRSNIQGGFIEPLRDVLRDEFALEDRNMKKLYHHSVDVHFGRLTKRLPVTPEADREIQKVRNPVVIQALFELRKVVNAVLEQYGPVDQIKIELARDLKNSKSHRNQIRREQKRREKFNDFVREELESHSLRVNYASILKYKLWLECEKQCPFTGKSISFNQLFGGSGEVQVEHILPFSKSLDDSFLNKTLCFADENRKKGNRTPYKYFTTDFDEGHWDVVKNRAIRQFYDVQDPNKYFPNRYRKYKRFVQQKFDEDFVSRQLNDTRYISKQASVYLKRICADVQVAPGMATSMFRHHWGMNSILDDEGQKNRDDHRHHAIDALVLCCIDTSTLQQLARIDKYGGDLSEVDEPWIGFRDDGADAVAQIFVSHKRSQKVLTSRLVYTKKKDKVFVNQGISVRGQLHKETVFGKPKLGEPDVYHVRKPIDSLTTKKQVLKVVDGRIRELIHRRVEQMGGYDPKGKVPKNTFFIEEDGKSIPQILLPNKNGDDIPVRKVRMKEVLSNAEQLKSDINQFVNPRNNHHALIYRTHDGALKESMVSFWTAAERRRQGLSVIQLPEDGESQIAYLAENEMFLIDPKGEIKNWSDQSKQIQGQHLYRVQKISSMDFNFKLHVDTRKDNSDTHLRVQSFGKWKLLAPTPVVISSSGELKF